MWGRYNLTRYFQATFLQLPQLFLWARLKLVHLHHQGSCDRKLDTSPAYTWDLPQNMALDEWVGHEPATKSSKIFRAFVKLDHDHTWGKNCKKSLKLHHLLAYWIKGPHKQKEPPQCHTVSTNWGDDSIDSALRGVSWHDKKKKSKKISFHLTHCTTVDV